MGALGTIMFLKDKEPASLILQVVVQTENSIPHSRYSSVK
jgi:hypothetical protein